MLSEGVCAQQEGDEGEEEVFHGESLFKHYSLH
jgi:hypothetical protein